MKQLNTFKSYLLIAVVALTLGSCSKKGDDIPDKADPKMLSFGFYAEDNDGNLFRDYVVSSVTGNTIQVELPKDVDKTKLVARFTTTDRVTVTASGVPQQSGTTQNDFSTPIDYIVTEGTTNARYTVTIVNAADYVWTRVGVYNDNKTSTFTMKVNPSTGFPYFLYQLNATEDADKKAFVAKYENNWSTIGENLSAGRVSDLAMSFDNDGKLYITYPDYGATVSRSPIVQRYDGSSWSNVGAGSVIPAIVTYSALGINPTNNQPILINFIEDRNYIVPRRALTVSYFNGSTWSIHNKITDRGDDQRGGIMKTKTIGDKLYLATINTTAPGTYSVYSYQQGTWTTIVNLALDEGATGTDIRDFDMDVDQEGNIYVAFADNIQEGVFRPRVKKYTAATQTWSQIGGIINVVQGTGRYFAIAVSPSGIPHMIFRNMQSFPEVVSFDTETQDWGTSTVLESVATENVFIDFAPDGTGYASYINATNNIVLQKYDTPN